MSEFSAGLAPEELLETSIAQAWAQAEERKAEVIRLAESRSQAALSEGLHVYDPLPYPEAEPADVRLYEGTGIGFLYGVEGCEHFATELGDWTLGKEPRA